MNRFLIEVEHEGSKESCDRALSMFLKTGSHFMTNADWGCGDDVHKAWIVADLDTKEEALRIVPPPYRDKTTITRLEKFSLANFKEKLPHREE